MTIITHNGLPEDIRKEFRVDPDGKVFANSISAIARLAGCRHSSIQNILDTLAADKSVSKALKAFAGHDYRCSREYPDLLVAAIVKHFAWYAQRTNQTAEENDLIFSAIGFRTLFQQQLGWKNPELTHDDSETRKMLKEVLVQIQTMQGQLARVLRTEEQYPGVANLSDAVNSQLLPPDDLEEPFTIREWVLRTKGVRLSRSECMSFGRYAANVLTTLKLESLEKYGTASVYRRYDSAGLETAWEGWSKFSRKK